MTTTFTSRFAYILGVGLAIGAAHQAQAQATDPGTGGPTATPTTVPIDGGASLLLAGSVAYGLRKLRQRRQK